jgi:Ca2+-binding EF-hand superfamily protein
MKRILPWVGSLAILRPWICIASRAQESSPEQQEEEEDAKPLKYMVEEKRQEMVVRYENRLRFFGTPEKVFNYFASALDGADQPAMTREDFVLSFTPFMRRQNIEEAEDKGAKGLMDVLLASTKAPGASGSLKSTRVVAKNTVPPQIETGAPKSSLDLIDSSGDGLISFPEYLFCLSLLSISAKDIELAFNMFDIDGNGNVDPQEFESVVQIMREQNSVFRSKRLDKYSVHDHEKLLDHFFGIKRDKKLQLSDFKDFVLSLQAEVLTLEFSYLADSKTKHLSGGNFIKLLVCHSGNFEEYL